MPSDYIDDAKVQAMTSSFTAREANSLLSTGDNRSSKLHCLSVNLHAGFLKQYINLLFCGLVYVFSPKNV